LTVGPVTALDKPVVFDLDYLRFMEYYLCKDGNTIGPCSIKDIQSFLHYGSIKLTDNVLLTGSSEWQPLSSLEELQKLSP